MDRKTRRQLLGFLTALMWIAALSASFGRFKLAAKASVAVNLGTTPANVKLTIDGTPFDSGHYVTTPAKIMIPPGKVTMKIQRDGYITHEVTVEARAGEVRRVENVVLERYQNATFAKLEVTFPQNAAPLNVEVDDGLLRGETPLMSDDLRSDAEHVLTVYPRWPERETKFRCRFVAAGDGSEVRIKLGTSKSGVVRAQGCERLKAEKVDKADKSGEKKKKAP